MLRALYILESHQDYFINAHRYIGSLQGKKEMMLEQAGYFRDDCEVLMTATRALMGYIV